MTMSPHTTRTVSHAEARSVARRLIAGSFRRDGERHDYDVGPRFSIPTRPDHDDDCLIVAYIEQREAADLVAYGDAPDVLRDIAAAQAVPIAEQFAEMERRHRQRQELPPLPPVGGYGVRHEGHYSAQQMRDYASAAVQHDPGLVGAHEAEEARLSGRDILARPSVTEGFRPVGETWVETLRREGRSIRGCSLGAAGLRWHESAYALARALDEQTARAERLERDLYLMSLDELVALRERMRNCTGVIVGKAEATS